MFLVSCPGWSGLRFVRTDIRKNIRVTMDILIELLSVFTHNYSWRVRDSMDILRIIRAGMDILFSSWISLLT